MNNVASSKKYLGRGSCGYATSTNLARSGEKKRAQKALRSNSTEAKATGARGQEAARDISQPFVNFCQLADDALAYSKRNKRSHKTDVPRLPV